MAVGLLFRSKHRSVGLNLYTAGIGVLQLQLQCATWTFQFPPGYQDKYEPERQQVRCALYSSSYARLLAIE